jgi:hypothetical protein
MITRCYNQNQRYINPTYEDCTVCDEWHNFQNFAQWYKDNYYTIENERMELDKDILIKNNKIYSPETCIFVPKFINILFVKGNKTRGQLPIGTSYGYKNNYIIASCGIVENGKRKQKNIGDFKNPEEAFKAYKTFKENYIKQIADQYKDKIPQKLYEAMYKYEVEITD